MKNKIYFFILISIFFITNSYSQELSNTDLKKVESYKQLIKQYKQEGNNNQAAHFTNQIAFLYWEARSDENAIYFFLKSISLNKRTGNKNAIKSIYRNIALIYSERGQSSIALDYFRKSLRYAKELGKRNHIFLALIDIATMLEQLDKNKEAIEELLLGLEIAQASNKSEYLKIVYGMLADNYKKIGNNEKYVAYFQEYSNYVAVTQKEDVEKQKKETHKKVKQMQDLANKAKIEQIAVEKEREEKEKELVHKMSELEKAKTYLYDIQRESEVREEQIDSLNRQSDLQKELLTQKEQQHESDRLIKTLLIMGIVLVIIFVLVLYRSFKQRDKINKELSIKNREIQKRSREIAQQNEAVRISRNHLRAKSEEVKTALTQIQEQNKLIHDSLEYAKDIQKAIFPSQNILSNYLKNSFILLKPKDIVSGDFFYFKKLDEQYFVIATVDCSGEGFSGSLISLIGYYLLDKVATQGTKTSNCILNELNKEFQKTLKQEEGKNLDSMDISLCLIDNKNKKIDFAGANQDLLFIRNQKMKLIEGNEVSIGGVSKNKILEFKHQIIDFKENDHFYLFSNGYSEQIGRTNKIYHSDNLYRLLLKISLHQMEQQKELLDRNFETWKGSKQQQVDDILIIGFSL